MPKKPSKAKRTVYDQNYYKAQTILRDPWFVKKVLWLKKRFDEVGCPIPPKGLKTYRDYQSWREKYWDVYSKMSRSAELLTKEKKITSGKDKVSFEEHNALQKLRADFLPPLYGAVFGDILEHFKIDRNDRKFHDFLEFHIFLDRTEYPTSLFHVRWIRNQKTDKMELFIQILGHTKREDIVNNWDFIIRDQHYLPNYVGKSKEWESFDRDLEIYELYKKLRDENPARRQKWKSVDGEIFSKLNLKYPSLTLGQIRNIITKTAKRLGETTSNR